MFWKSPLPPSHLILSAVLASAHLQQGWPTENPQTDHEKHENETEHETTWEKSQWKWCEKDNYRYLKKLIVYVYIHTHKISIHICIYIYNMYICVLHIFIICILSLKAPQRHHIFFQKAPWKTCKICRTAPENFSVNLLAGRVTFQGELLNFGEVCMTNPWPRISYRCKGPWVHPTIRRRHLHWQLPQASDLDCWPPPGNFFKKRRPKNYNYFNLLDLTSGLMSWLFSQARLEQGVSNTPFLVS